MNKMKISLCSLAVTMAIGMSSSAWAVNNDLNPLTGTPLSQAPMQSSVSPQGSNGLLNPTQEQIPAVSGQDTESKEDTNAKNNEKDSLDDSYDETRNNLKKAAGLNAAITVAKLEKELKDIKNPPKEQNNNSNNSNGANPFNGQSFSQNGMPQQGSQQFNMNQQQATPVVVPVVKKPETVIQATAVYSLGKATYAEIYFNGNKFVATKGSPLPNGYRLVGLSDYGVTLKKGNTKIELPIVSSQFAAKSVPETASAPSTPGSISSLSGQSPMPAPNGQQINVSTTPPPGFGPAK